MKPALTQPPGQSLQEVLGAEVPDNRIAKAISEALTATLTTRAGSVEPDHKTRLQAVTLALSYRHGLPLRREESISLSIESDSDNLLAQRLAKSPALRQALRRMLAEHGEGSTIDIDACPT